MRVRVVYLHRDILHKNIYIYNTHGNASFVYAAGDTNSIFNVLLMAYDDHRMGNGELYIIYISHTRVRYGVSTSVCGQCIQLGSI